MSSRRTTFGKLQRERAKKAKAAAKRERRQERVSEAAATDAAVPAPDGTRDDPLATLSAAELLRLVELTHERFQAGLIGLEEFEEKKAELFALLPDD